MTCPECGAKVKVTESYAADYGRRRRYLCGSGHRFTTAEIVVKRSTMKTVLVEDDGVVTVVADEWSAVRGRVMRAIERALR